MYLHSIRRLMNRLSQPGQRGHRQTGHAGRCSSPGQKRVPLLCERLEDRLTPGAVKVLYDGPGTVATVDVGSSSKIDIGQIFHGVLSISTQGSTFDPDSTLSSLGLRYNNGLPENSNIATIDIGNSNAISNLDVRLFEQATATIASLFNTSEGISNLSVVGPGNTEVAGPVVHIPGRQLYVTDAVEFKGSNDMSGGTIELGPHRTLVDRGATVSFSAREGVFSGPFDVESDATVNIRNTQCVFNKVSVNGDGPSSVLTLAGGNFTVQNTWTLKNVTADISATAMNGRSDVSISEAKIRLRNALFDERLWEMKRSELQANGGAWTLNKLTAEDSNIDITNGRVELNTLTLTGSVFSANQTVVVANKITQEGGANVTVAGGGVNVDTWNVGPGASLTGTQTTVKVQKMDNDSDMLWFAAAFGVTDLKNTLGKAAWNSSLVNVRGCTNNGQLNFNDSNANFGVLTSDGTLGVDPRSALTSQLTRINGGSVDIEGLFRVAQPVPMGNHAFIFVGPNGRLLAPSVDLSGGSTLNDNGVVNANIMNIGGILSGVGTVFGNVLNFSVVIPGIIGQTGVLTVVGDFAQEKGGTLFMQIGGIGPGQYSQLVVTGKAQRGGTLVVAGIKDFAPPSGSDVQITKFGAGSGKWDNTDFIALLVGRVILETDGDSVHFGR